jgi:hypothetical protein
MELLLLLLRQNMFRGRSIARFGLLDLRTQAEIHSALRTDTPRSI